MDEEQLKKVGERSPNIAEELFPYYLKYEREILRLWGKEILKIWKDSICALENKPTELLSVYLENSLHIIELIGLEGFQKWIYIGELLEKISISYAHEYQRITPSILKNIKTKQRRVKALSLSERLIFISPKIFFSYLKMCPHPIMTLDYHNLDTWMENGIKLAMSDENLSLQYFEANPEILNYLKKDNLTKWVDYGLQLSSHDKNKALAFFGLKSRIGSEMIQKIIHGINLHEYSNVLKHYARALYNINIDIKPLHDRPEPNSYFPHNIPFTDGKTMYAPLFIDECKTKEDNFKIYKVITAHEMGHVYYGTFNFSLSNIQNLVEALQNQYNQQHFLHKEEKQLSNNDLHCFFWLFPNPHIAEKIFCIVEDGRIDHRLREEYAGLRKDLDFLSLMEIEKRPLIQNGSDLQIFIEQFLYLTSTRKTHGELPENIGHVLRHAYHHFNQIKLEGATVEDTATVTSKIYQLLDENLGIPVQNNQSTPELDDMDDTQRNALDKENEERDNEDNTRRENFMYRGNICQEFHLNQKRNETESNTHEEVSISLIPDNMNIKDYINLHMYPYSTFEHGEFIQNVLTAAGKKPFIYDEWDYKISDYRTGVCKLWEMDIENENKDAYEDVIGEYSHVIPAIKKEFLLLKPEAYKWEKRQLSGDEFDLNATVEHIIDRFIPTTPDDKVYLSSVKKDRDLSVSFLVDMSLSTNLNIKKTRPVDKRTILKPSKLPRRELWRENIKRIIDIERDTLILMSLALEYIKDRYSIYGFSSNGRDLVEFFTLKDFSESLNSRVKERICGLTPKKSTRLGTVIRHATAKLYPQQSKTKLLILLSDGRPEDYCSDYSNRRYAIEDTKMALKEARKKGITLFCIIICYPNYDISEVFGEFNYIIMDDVKKLPEKLPRIYQKLTS
ncbi:MAG: VWA domain-containing protein [Thermodesulfobacteriota bacterium]|nr:VWA domain-containing protein [Thermodesulfobacteriota bacterium]